VDSISRSTNKICRNDRPEIWCRLILIDSLVYFSFKQWQLLELKTTQKNGILEDYVLSYITSNICLHYEHKNNAHMFFIFPSPPIKESSLYKFWYRKAILRNTYILLKIICNIQSRSRHYTCHINGALWHLTISKLRHYCWENISTK